MAGRIQRREVELPEEVPWRGAGGLRAAILETHEQGEHVSVFGPTGTGKTTVSLDLLQGFHDLGGHCVILTNKPRDRTISELLSSRPREWSRIRGWPPDYGDRVKRGLVLWPDYPGTNEAARRKVAGTFRRAIDALMREGAWYVFLDEANYLVEQLGLKKYLDELWQQSRSSDISVIAGAQRPVWTSKGMTTQQKWVLAFRPDSDDDADAVGRSLGGRARWGPVLEELRYRAFVTAYLPRRRYYVSTVRTGTGARDELEPHRDDQREERASSLGG